MQELANSENRLILPHGITYCSNKSNKVQTAMKHVPAILVIELAAVKRTVSSLVT